MSIDLENVTTAQLKSALKKREKPEPLFERDGIRYYDVPRYNRLLEYYGEEGIPQDFTPIDIDKDGRVINANPQEVVINLEALTANRVRKDLSGIIHIVFDTFAIREADSNNINVGFVSEYILTKGTGKQKYNIKTGVVNKEDFLKYYVDSFNVPDALEIMNIIERSAIDSKGTATMSLSDIA